MKIKTHFNVNELPDTESCNPGLTPNHNYIVIGIDYENYRIVNDDFEPILYPKNIFDVIEPNYPDYWVKTEFDDGEYYIDPPEFSGIGFFEDYFDGVSKVILIYNKYLKINGIKK